MVDEMFEEKKKQPPKSRTLGSVKVSALKDVPEWKYFVDMADAAKSANEDHENAKRAMREVFRKKLKQTADTVIEFSKNGETVTVTEILEKKQPKRAKASDMSELFSKN